MIDQSENRIFNIGSGQGRSLVQVIASIEALLDRKLKINWGLRRIDVPSSVLSAARAKKVLGWAPVCSP